MLGHGTLRANQNRTPPEVAAGGGGEEGTASSSAGYWFSPVHGAQWSMIATILSRVVATLFDVPVARLFDGRVLDFHSEATASRIGEMVRLVKDGQRQVPLSLKLVTHAGVDRYLVVKLVPLLDRSGSAPSTCALLYDITALVAAERKLTRVPVSLREEIQLLAPEEIVYVRADNVHTVVHTPDDQYLCDLSLTALEKRLAQDLFFRIHRSVLVNVGCVRKVHRDRSECTVDMRGFEARLPISRNRVGQLMITLGLKEPGRTWSEAIPVRLAVRRRPLATRSPRFAGEEEDVPPREERRGDVGEAILGAAVF